MRIYYWIHHTGDYAGNTGVQRVVRNVADALSRIRLDLVLVRWCPEREAIVRAERRLAEGLSCFGGPRLEVGPEAGVPLHLAEADRDKLAGAWLMVPEVPHLAGPVHPNLAVAFDYARYYGMRSAAIFYDLIPLLQPGYEALAPDHEWYARALVAADLVLAISGHAGDTLRDWWHAAGYEPARLPRLLARPLPEEIIGLPRVTVPDGLTDGPVRFVAFGTLEPRKNQLQAMRAFARLCARRQDLDLAFDLVGNLHEDVAAVAKSVARAEPRIRLHGYLPDEQVHALVRASCATVFLSLEEGYGLPVAESLWQGKPCLASNRGAVAEVASQGGCLMVDPVDPVAIENGFERLAEDRALRRRLSEEACARPLRTWQAYGQEIVDALAAMPPIDRLFVIEGTGDPGTRLASDLTKAGVMVRRLHWRSDSRSLLPGAACAPEQPAPGDGQLRGAWAIFPLATAMTLVEATDIIEMARALGLKVALEADAETSLDLLASADLVLVADTATREAILTRGAPGELSGTAGISQRILVGTGAAGLPAIALARPPLTEAGPSPRPKRVYYWVGLTVTQPFNTGVQRVTRLLASGLQRLGVQVVPVKWDDTASAMVPIASEEAEHLAKWRGPQTQVLRALPENLAGEWMLLPEITIPVVPPDSHVVHLAHSRGMRAAAIFYDLIPAKMPENYPQIALDYLTQYWTGFAHVDVALPISWTMAGDLSHWLREKQLPLPPIVPCPLAGEGASTERTTKPSAETNELRLLAVGTWEPRKNYLRLLRALAEVQTQAQRPIRLTIVGRRAGFAELDAEIERLATAADVELLDHVSDETLLELHEAAAATVFASWEEGFGLPVLESLWRGRPCLCHAGSAMAEVAPGGGVLQINMTDETAIAAALLRLADEPGLVARLGAEAARRPIRSWDEYAEDVIRALSRVAAAPGWPLPAVARRRPLLTCAIATSNRGPWLSHTLQRVSEATRPWRDVVEVAVCDYSSADDTQAILARFAGEQHFMSFRHSARLNLPVNLHVLVQNTRGAFVWLLADDTILLEGAIENMLEGLAVHPDVESVYLNYAQAHFENPEQLAEGHLIAATRSVAPSGPNQRLGSLNSIKSLGVDFFRVIDGSALRRDHALRSYGQGKRSSLTCSLASYPPASEYALTALLNRPAWWIGAPAFVANTNKSIP